MSLNQPHLPSPAATPDGPLPSNTTAQPEQSQYDLCQSIETKLLNLTQDLYELEICAGEVVEGQQQRIPDFLKRINESFVELEGMSKSLTESVPRQVIENVDTYHNPHMYTKNSLSRATGENQYALGRVLGLESFRRQLYDALATDFPTIPLPERRHQPSPPEPVNGINGVKVEREAMNGANGS
ncbi:hypothetical protein BD324DRAFT_66596 [Kockovaella imperatae]|uniref:Mediator of RNA polymerase II transcription subunit 10 n=1 Tax=Kockovaella imperatae TaxID=4999 RepID=A0A1Y1UC79_9TREE|nr:hypothetical protein BD324DRAFT_66596 [Kockovaella imperatae]ORX35650.1 hypothetical protein BD324DRAFT_66596 [Kockovaella imperatae]